MKKQKSIWIVVLLALTLTLTATLAACSEKLTPKPDERDFQLIDGARAAVICVEGTNAAGSTDGDYPGVVRAAYDLQSDIETITGVKPVVTKSIGGYADYAIIIGTLEKSKAIQKIAELGKIDAAAIEGKWESYIVENVADPFGDGKVKTALVVAGSDKRGAIYGTYSISEQLGMSPWHYFADSVPAHKDNFVLPASYKAVGVEPDVKYRGIFINDEETLETWARVLDEGAHLGPNLYEKIFEMLLRAKANYLWPGMHACSDAFSDYAANPVNADYYGIVIGTSHCDMLLRNNLNEWSAFQAEYRKEHPEVGEIEYDYTVSPEIIREYWRRSVRANKDYEVQWTLGMRGAHDDPFDAKNIDRAPWYGDKNMLMEQIIEDQREILRTELKNPKLEDVFMMFIPYKEVQLLYNDGLEVPEDITIMWADDNHGFIRNLPNEVERERSGGHGIYYHNSYWGPDNESYMWVNSMPFTMIYEEMNKAYTYGVQKAWILNAGDTVPYMPEIEFFVSLGYDMDQYTHENVFDVYVTKMATREFGAEYASDMVEIYKQYTLLTNARKLEQMSVDLFSAAYNDEAERRAAQYRSLYELAERVNAALPERQRDCFYETVLFEVRCAYYTNLEFYYAHKGNVAYAQGRNATAYNCYNMSKEFNQKRKDEISYYNRILSQGKWNKLMDPEVYHSPVMSGFANGGPAFLAGEPEMGVVAEGEPVEQAASVLSFGNYARGRKYIDVFNKGAGSFDITVTADKPFIVIGDHADTVTDEVRIWISVDFSALASSDAGTVTISDGETTKTVTVNAIVNEYELGEKTYVEQDGYVSIEAEHYSAERTSDFAYWSVIKDLGRGGGDMVRAESKTLVGYGDRNFEAAAPYLEYNVYFASTGAFETEVYRLPTLSSLGRIRLAVQLNDGTPIILEGEKDYGTNNPAWEEGVFTQIIKHKTTLTVTEAGLNRIRLYMLDPFITVDKLVVYTATKQASYFGPTESYNTTFNVNGNDDTAYAGVYQSKYVVPEQYDIARTYGNGYFVEQGGTVSIEAESAALTSTGVSIRGRWIPARTIEGYTMRTEKLREDFDGRWETDAPSMNYDMIVSAGTYNVWVRLNAPMPRSSVYAIGIDGKYKFLQTNYSYSEEESFVWRKAGTQLKIDAAGKYTLNFFCSQDAMVIDAIYLTKSGETPDKATFRQSPRTTVWTGNVADSTADAKLRQTLLTALEGLDNYHNIIAGDALGEYGAAEKATLIEKMDIAYTLLNLFGGLVTADVETAVRELNEAKTALLASRNMAAGGTNYLLYEDYDKAHTGLAPFGFSYHDLYLSPDVSVTMGADGEKFFNIRTFNEQRNTERALVSYAFAPQATKLTVEARMSFNEAEWGKFYILNEYGDNAVCLAFEFAYNRYNLVAYDRGAKKTVAAYERNVPVDVKLEIDVAANTYDVSVAGQKVAEGFAFRNASDRVGEVIFGSAARDADMRVYELKAY